MKRFIVGFIPLSFMVGLPAIAGCIACVLAAALLACASSTHSQVIEEGGFTCTVTPGYAAELVQVAFDK